MDVAVLQSLLVADLGVHTEVQKEFVTGISSHAARRNLH